MNAANDIHKRHFRILVDFSARCVSQFVGNLPQMKGA